MPRNGKALTARKVETVTAPGYYGDGKGLYLQISGGGARSWIYRFQLAGRRRDMGIGPCDTVTLAEARHRALAARRHVKDGVDPIEARRTERANAALAAARGLTFKDAGERYIAAHEASWRNAKHREQWGATLATYVYPVFGDLSVADVDVALILKVLEPIWATKSETAGRVRGRIEAILDWATARGYRQGDNPARWRGHLDKLLPSRGKVRRVTHHAALPYAETGAFMAKLAAQVGVAPRCLEFVILTCCRTGEAIGARWPEIDLSKKLWTIPGERMKAGREHRVPLSDRAVAILKALPREKGSEFVFIGGKAGTHLSNMALLETLRRMGRDDLTTHGFRSTFRDWSAEQTNYAREVCELALAHAVGDKVEAAYRRGDLFEKRRSLANEWARYTAKPSGKDGNVVAIRKKAERP